MDLGSLWDLANGLGAGLLALGLKRRRPLQPPKEHPVRRRLLDVILRRPGVRLASLWRELDAHRKTTKYHLFILERANLIASLKAHQTTRYFPSTTPLEERLAVTVLLRGRVLEMATLIAKNPGMLQQELGEALKLSRRVMRLYADLLVERGLLDEVTDGHGRRYYPTTRLQELLPSLAEEAQ